MAIAEVKLKKSVYHDVVRTRLRTSQRQCYCVSLYAGFTLSGNISSTVEVVRVSVFKIDTDTDTDFIVIEIFSHM